MHCSKECGDTAWARWEAAGEVQYMKDLTLEQINETFNKHGLALAGVGNRTPS
jgi:hypothetical protein